MNETSECPTAAVVIIGNEILSGRTRDVNLNTIARKLLPLGIPVVESRIVRDEEAEIVEAVNALRARVTYVFTTGGIGPTHDDITAGSIAKAFDLPLERHPAAAAILAAYYTDKNLNPERLGMAEMPRGAVLIANPVSVIPGFRIENVYVLAGVPEVMQAMLDTVAHELRHGPCLHTVTVNCALTEGVLAGDLSTVAGRFPDLEIGSYPSLRLGKIGVALVVRGRTPEDVASVVDDIKAIVQSHGGTPEVETAG
jgi:molybdenum cofactor synthesis domain-containing protein